MKLMVTGASGFLGRYVVDTALARGHEVVAVVRPATDCSSLAWCDHPSVRFAREDLRAPHELVEALTGVDAVLHLAAAKTGDLYAQLAASVVGTEKLLGAMKDAGVNRLVAVSSFSVYDYLRKRSFSVLDETSPTEPKPFEREVYATTKLLQENLVRAVCTNEKGWKLTVVRPGVIYGPGSLWTDQLGIRLGDRLCLRMGMGSTLRMTYVENCATAIVLGAEREEAIGAVLNVVDDDLPSRHQYAKAIRRLGAFRGCVLPMSGLLMRFLARSAWIVNHGFFDGRVRLPWFLVPAKLHVQMKPLRFSNRRAKETLGWTPEYSFDQAMAKVAATGDSSHSGSADTATSSHNDLSGQPDKVLSQTTR